MFREIHEYSRFTMFVAMLYWSYMKEMHFIHSSSVCTFTDTLSAPVTQTV